MTMTSMPMDNAVSVVADPKISIEMLAHVLIMQVQTVEVMNAAGTTVKHQNVEITMTVASLLVSTVVLVVADLLEPKAIVLYAENLEVQTVEVTTVAGTTVARTSAEVTIAAISSQIETVVPVVAEIGNSILTMAHVMTLKEKTVRAINAAGTSLTQLHVEITIMMISTPVQCAVFAEVSKNY